ncbi:MAG: insulinase family protein [Bacteroidota bacterium]|nr:insulinase family protein [Bacteroidota bacterium]
MKLARAIFLLLLALFLSPCIGKAEDMKTGQTYEGFKLLEKRFVSEVNAECLYFIHEKSGARLFKIKAQDDNKTFAIAFRTDPESNWGTPHIIEHSTLNGSKSFPVKSPYDVLRKGSLLTFINAFTGQDMTCFPVASKNNKDYFNLMHVYLDAVFQPNFKTDTRILKQEGWHYEMESKDGPISYKGVVYNEMKGVYSNPTGELNYQVNRLLFPDNGYRFSSGGYPKDIPGLTQEAFVKYHNKYYHPSNCYILLYGDADINKELEFINKEYLNKYEKAVQPEVFPIQKPFPALKSVTLPYAVSEGMDTLNQTYLSFSVVVGLNTDRALVMGLNTLCDVLVNQEAAPIRLALQKAAIGSEVTATVDEMHQNVFGITVQNANGSDKDKFLSVILQTLKEVAEKGIDKKAIEGSLNRTEFSLREGNNSQQGLNYAFQILPGWFFANDPFLTLEYEKPLAKVKTALTGDYLERIIKEEILNNPHSLLISLEPKPGYDKQLNAQTALELDKFKSSLSEEEKDKLIKETKDLVAYQKREDSPEALATVPMLERKDINPAADWYELKENIVEDVPVLSYEAFSNNVVYTRLFFDLRVLPQELLPYAAILTEVLGNQNTKTYSYGDLNNQLNISTGGFSAFINTYAEKRDDNNLIPKFVVSSKAMDNKTNEMFDLIGEILNRTKYEDTDRLKAILLRYQSRLDAQVKENGLTFAQIRTLSYFTNMGMFNELTGGISYYWLITDLARNFDKRSDEIKSNLIKTASLLFNKNNMTMLITCSKGDRSECQEKIGKFITSFDSKPTLLNKWKFSFQKKNEGLQTPSKVQYVVKGYNIKKLGFDWNGKVKVLNQIISRDWLHNRIRVIGGAYGGFSSVDDLGNFVFMSYRDPNLKETLENYNATIEYLDKLQLKEKDITRYIIGTIAAMDAPLSVSQKANTAITNYFNNVSREDLQKLRDAVLNTSMDDIKSLRKMIKAVLEQNAYCVYGNDEKISEQKDLFGSIEKIIR